MIFQKGLRVTYLPQSPKFPEHATVLSYVADGADGADWGRESEAKNALNRLGLQIITKRLIICPEARKSA